MQNWQHARDTLKREIIGSAEGGGRVRRLPYIFCI